MRHPARAVGGRRGPFTGSRGFASRRSPVRSRYAPSRKTCKTAWGERGVLCRALPAPVSYEVTASETSSADFESAFSSAS